MFHVLLTLQYISIGLLGLESIYVFFKGKTKQQHCLFLYCLSATVNNLGYAMEMMAQNAREAMVGVRFCYFGKVWIPLSFFVIVMEFCEIKLPKKFYAVLTAIHCSTFILVLTAPYHSWYYTTKSFVETGLFPHYEFGHAMLYNLYMTIVEGYIIVGIFAIYRKLKQDLDKRYKKTLLMFFAAAVSMAIGVICHSFQLIPGYDCTCMGYLFAGMIMLVSLHKHRLMDTLSLVRDYVADTLMEGLVAVNRSGMVVYYNDSLRKIHPEIEKKPKAVLHMIQQRAQSGEVLELDDRIYETRREELLHDGGCQGSLYVISDVTDRVRHVEQLQEQKDIAEKANASKSAFLSIVSHEIRTPMNAVVGMTDLLLQEELTEKQRKYMTNIRNSGAALVMIINDILDQSKIEAGKMEIVEEPYEIRPLLEDVRMIVENRIGEKNITLVIKLDEHIPRLMIGDGLRIRQIFINLLNNAVKFTEQGYIQLSATILEETERAYRIRFAVKDSGQGIRKEDLDKLGKAFSQVDVERNHGKEGTGLGLSISKDFIAMMGGELKVDSTYGEGSEFYFIIEQKKTGKNSDETVTIEGTEKVEEFLAPGVKALVVDDTSMNLMVMRNMLKHLEMDVTTAASGEQAVELVKKEKFDVIFMDYMMPGMDGVATTEMIRRLGEKQNQEKEAGNYRSIPIIALTGDVSKETQELFTNAGVTDFIEKPVEFNKVRSRLMAWLPEEFSKK